MENEKQQLSKQINELNRINNSQMGRIQQLKNQIQQLTNQIAEEKKEVQLTNKLVQEKERECEFFISTNQSLIYLLQKFKTKNVIKKNEIEIYMDEVCKIYFNT